MLIKKALLILLFLFILSSSYQLSTYAAPVDDWQKLILNGSAQKFDGQYDVALQLYTKALAFAENNKLPPKCLPISLCRLAGVEVITNRINEADSHFHRIIDLIKEQREAGTLDPQVTFWAAALSDEYLDNMLPKTRETCLRRACYLKDLIYNDTHNECIGCLNKLASYYIDQGKVDKAIHFLTLVQSVIDKKYGKNPNGLGETLNQLALKCKTEHKYEQATQLELEVIKIANTNSSGMHAGLPAFYSFLSMNAFAQEKATEGKDYFSIAKKEGSKIKGKKQQDLARPYFDALIQPIVIDQNEQKLDLAELEFRELLKIKQVIFDKLEDQYQIFSHLAALLDIERRPSECKTYLDNCIHIAQIPKSSYQNELPDLYMRLAGSAILQRNFVQANEAFSKALKLERNKTGFPSAKIWLFWGWTLEQHHQLAAAEEKLNMALKIARTLPPQKRGTIIVDASKIMSQIFYHYGKTTESQKALQEYSSEIRIQDKIKSNLGPNLDFHHAI